MICALLKKVGDRQIKTDVGPCAGVGVSPPLIAEVVTESWFFQFIAFIAIVITLVQAVSWLI